VSYGHWHGVDYFGMLTARGLQTCNRYLGNNQLTELSDGLFDELTNLQLL
jgi:hypothetical protein